MPHHEKEQHHEGHPEMHRERMHEAEQKARGEHAEIHPTGTKKYAEDYRLGDMEVLYRRGHWSNWHEMIDWLRKNGEKDNEFTPGEVVCMIDNLEKVERSGKPFTHNPEDAYKLAHGYHTHQGREMHGGKEREYH